jgi:hypothetical protein
LFGKPLKGKKEIKKCTREMSSKGKVRSAGRARLISIRAEKQRWKWFWLQEQWGLQGDTIMEYLMWIFLEMATGQEHVTATHFYYFLTRWLWSRDVLTFGWEQEDTSMIRKIRTSV